MSGKIHVVAGPPLSGTVRVQGAKNSVLKLMVACLLAEGQHAIAGAPRITDVEDMAALLAGTGARVGWRPAALATGEAVLGVDVPAALEPVAPAHLVERMRASVVLLGPLLARCGEAHLPMPGGDDFGARPIDIHVRCLEAMGAHVKVSGGEVAAYVPGGRLAGTRLVLEYPSHTATDNLLMAAVLAEGHTTIENAACEPEVADLASFLRSMGARISGEGTSRIEVDGVSVLQSAPEPHPVIPDRVEAATLLVATGLAGGEVVLEGARIEHLDMLLVKLDEIGVHTRSVPGGIAVSAAGRPHAADVSTLPYPGVATDYKPFLVALLAVADGVSFVTENIFAGRFRYVDELVKMGADVRTEGHHVVVRGRPRLAGAHVTAPDIRAGAALVLAGLAADGETVVGGAAHVERGYEDFAGKLSALGAEVRALDR